MPAVAGGLYEGRHPGVNVPMFTALLPVSAPSDDVCARNTGSCRDRTLAKSSETAHPV